MAKKINHMPGFESGGQYPPVPEDIFQGEPSRAALDLFSGDLVREFRAFPFAKNADTVKIAAENPDDPALRAFVEGRISGAIEWFLARDEDIARALAFYDADSDADFVDIPDVRAGTDAVSAIADRIVRGAIHRRASDIHIEPTRAGSVVRLRIDGTLHEAAALPATLHSALVARFKILSNLKIDESRRPQDGRFEPEGVRDVSLRISTVPTLYGEKIALRILDDANKNLTLERLGFSDSQRKTLQTNINKPFGMIVTSGPTGSGKTTTLYALMDLLEKKDINISTLEDPIEYALDGVNQIQINSRVGLTFASGLRALLRQDPDIIMVGEIRDSETAVMAANAALTGHLVFTTMHTNDAAGAIARFLEMKVEDFVTASVLTLVIAQRLVRKICSACAAAQKLSPAGIKKIGERPDVVLALERGGIGMSGIGRKKFSVGKGCKTCLQTGYRDRIGLFEFLELDRRIAGLVLEHAGPERIREEAAKAGFRDMVSDGVEKVLLGLTTIDEVLRTTRN
ncbi:MAG: GspE/PulE family protein [Patescibacteria group bacterium]